MSSVSQIFPKDSYEGLRDQLIIYTEEAAEYAINNWGADCNEQAVKVVEKYQEFMAMSQSQLIDQLIYEKFTPEQSKNSVENAQ